MYRAALKIDHRGIFAGMGDERFMRTGFEDFATLAEHVDAIGLFYRLQAMRDDDNRSSFEQFVERIGNGRFGKGIKCTRRFVEHEDFGIAEKDAGNGQALSLASGKAYSFFTDHRSESFRETVDKIAFRMVECPEDSLVRRMRIHADHQVLADSSVEYGWFLWEVSNVRKIRIQSNFG